MSPCLSVGGILANVAGGKNVKKAQQQGEKCEKNGRK
jgi:hypothetical protein